MQYQFWKFGLENPKIIKYCQTEYNKYASIGFNVCIVCFLISLCLNQLFQILAIKWQFSLILTLLTFVIVRWHYLLIFYLINYSFIQKSKRIILSSIYMLITMPILFNFCFIAFSNKFLNEQIEIFSNINSILLPKNGMNRIFEIVKILINMAQNDKVMVIVFVTISLICLMVIFIPIIMYSITYHNTYKEIKSQLKL